MASASESKAQASGADKIVPESFEAASACVAVFIGFVCKAAMLVSEHKSSSPFCIPLVDMNPMIESVSVDEVDDNSCEFDGNLQPVIRTVVKDSEGFDEATEAVDDLHVAVDGSIAGTDEAVAVTLFCRVLTKSDARGARLTARGVEEVEEDEDNVSTLEETDFGVSTGDLANPSLGLAEEDFDSELVEDAS